MASINSPSGTQNTLDGVVWPVGGGDINLKAGSNTTITPNNTTKEIEIASSGGSATGLTTVDTVALLKVTTGISNGEHCYLGGYYAAGAGGGGIVRRNTSLSSFNEGTTFDHDTESGGWERVLDDPGVVTVKQFGAKGDDTTDDTARAQVAVDYVNAQPYGGVVLVERSSARYIINGLVLKDEVAVRSEGGFGGAADGDWGAGLHPLPVFLGTTAGWVVDTPSTQTFNTGLQGIHVAGQGASPAIGGVRFRDVAHGSVSNCTFINMANQAIQVVAGVANVIKDNLAYNCLSNRTRSQLDGVVELGGTDHWMVRGEYSSSANIEGGLAGGTAVVTGTAQAGASTTITLAAGASSTTDFYKDWLVDITGGTGPNQTRRISAYNGTTKVATVQEAWGTTPGATSTYKLSPLRCAAVKVTGSTNWLDSVVCEISDVGLYMKYGAGGYNRLSSVRCDLNYGPGAIIEDSCQATNLLVLSNGRLANDSYDNLLVIGAQYGTYASLLASSNQANLPRYGFNFQMAGHDIQKINAGQLQSLVHTRQSVYTNHPFANHAIETPDGSPKTFTASDTTPSVDNYGFFKTNNGSATTITNFDDGFGGQQITILAQDANTTVQHNGSTIYTATAANVALQSNRIYGFRNYNGAWYQEA